MKPLFEFTDHYDSSITVGGQLDEETKEIVGGTKVPIKVKRLSRTEVDALEQNWALLMTAPRGVATGAGAPCAKCGATADEKAELLRIKDWDESSTKDRMVFWESTIRDCITLDEGLIVNRGKAVTDGAGIIEVFYARKDVLRALVYEVYLQNRLAGILPKNSKPPRASATGSEASAPTSGGPAHGGGPGSTAGNAANSSTARSADATDGSSNKDGESESSGEKSQAAKVH